MTWDWYSFCWCREVSVDWDINQSNFSVCQQVELMGSPWFSRVRQTEKHILSSSGEPVPGLFFLEASNPGGSRAWRHRAPPPTPPVCRCAARTLSFPPELTNTNLCSGPDSGPSIRLKHTAYIWGLMWPRGLNFGGRRCWVNMWAGVGTLSSLHLLFPASPLPLLYISNSSASHASCDQEVWLPSISPPDRKEIL